MYEHYTYFVADVVRSQIKNRGVKVFTGLLRRYSKSQDQDNGVINRYELEKGLIDFRIDIPQEVKLCFVYKAVVCVFCSLVAP